MGTPYLACLQWKNLPRKIKGCAGVKFEGPSLSGLAPISAVRFHFFDIARDAASGVADCALCPEKTYPAVGHSQEDDAAVRGFVAIFI